MSSTVFVNSVTLTASSWFQDVDNVAYQYLSGVSGTNTITATGPAGLGAYAVGLKFRFIPAVTNTGATTINITGTAALGARNIFNCGVALSGGELIAGLPTEIIDDGTRFQLLTGQVNPTFTSAEVAIGAPASTTTVAHGLGVVPRHIFVAIRNKTTEFGYSVGDEIDLSSTDNGNGRTIYSDATNVGIVLVGAIAISRRDTFANGNITAANWKYIVRAYR